MYQHLKVEENITVLYINTITHSTKQNNLNIIEVPLDQLNMSHFLGTVNIQYEVKYYFVVTNEEYLLYFKRQE